MLPTILLIAGFICFVIAALNVPVPRFNLVAWGLLFWVTVSLIGAGGVPFIFLAIAAICFFLAALSIPIGNVNLIAAGLAAWIFTQLLGAF